MHLTLIINWSLINFIDWQDIVRYYQVTGNYVIVNMGNIERGVC